jgi:hypothetical protein
MNGVLRAIRARALGANTISLAIAIVAAALSFIWIGIGILSPPGILTTAGVVVLGLGWLLIAAPQLLFILAPSLMPLPILGNIFAFELALGALTIVLLLRLVRSRSPWLTRLNRIDIMNGALVFWVLFSGFWCSDRVLYTIGIRRFIEGWVTFWVAYRVTRYVSRPWFETGLLSCATLLAVAALQKRLSFGMDVFVSRAAATNLGWGTANYVATLLMLLSPPILAIAMGSAQRWLRWFAWPILGLIAMMQVLIASRAVSALFAIGILVQLSRGQIRRRWLGILAAITVFAGLLMSPWGQDYLARFGSPRDIGSMIVRIWYFREAWHRTLDNLPWGIGINQGLAYPDHLGAIDPHNYWLVLSSELGIPGVLLWVGVLVVISRTMGRMAKTSGWEAEGRALLVSFWLSQFHTLVEPTFQGVGYQFLYFWLIGGYFSYAAITRVQRAPIASIER